MIIRSNLIWLLAVLIAFACGCGSAVDCVPASGKVTLNGDPLEGVQVTTEPVEIQGSRTDYSGSRGVTDASGNFGLSLLTDDREGAIPGKHAIYISFGDDPSLVDPDKPKIPMSYWDGSLRVQIPDEGTDSLNFDIETGK